MPPSTSRAACGATSTPPGRDAAGSQPLKGLRIGVPAEYFGAGLAPDVAAAVEAALAQFEALGAVRVPVSLPRTELAIPAYYVIAPPKRPATWPATTACATVIGPPTTMVWRK